MANVLDFATELGRELYRCGAETFRIEDTVRRVILAFTKPGTEVDVFAIPAFLSISVKLPDGNRNAEAERSGRRADRAPDNADTGAVSGDDDPINSVEALEAIRVLEVEALDVDEVESLELEAEEGHVLHRSLRMTGISYNLESLEKINHLSRNISGKKLSLEEAFAELKIIREEAAEAKPILLKPLSSACVGTGFALMLHAPLRLLPFTFIIGFFLYYSIPPLEERGLNRSLLHCYGAFFVTFMTRVFEFSGFLQGAADTVNIAVLMVLVPGMQLTNGARDLMAGDTVSGLSNLTEALLAAFALALGSGIALYLSQWIF